MAADRARSHPDAQHALAAIRTELSRVRSSVSRIERDLNELEAGERGSGAQRRRPERYLRVLIDVYERGGRHGVAGEEWAAIGARHGYDRRGLGGFFTGANAPLRRIEGRVLLTVSGEQLIDGYLAGLQR
ncbi:MAG TPA: hypothetical protein VKV27_08320 [Solirubrobacteraceae bacterium]|nr:hypothetical protein [Solirubrobacteraceae bacterium]